MTSTRQTAGKTAFSRTLSLLCIFLIAFVGVVEVVHVHPANSKISSHECSICAVAHSGVLSKKQYRPAPVFGRITLVTPSEVTTKSSGFTHSQRIRPPPAEV